MPTKMKRTTKRAIQEFAVNPTATCRDVAKKCGISKSAADNIRFKYKNEISRERNRMKPYEVEEQMELDLSQFPTVEELARSKDRMQSVTTSRMTVDNVVDERAITYGKFENLAEVSQRFKDSLHYFLITRNKYLAPDQQEAMELIFHKFARIVNGDPDHIDNWKDIAGYATLVADRLEGNPR
jgi:hypothetical protein